MTAERMTESRKLQLPVIDIEANDLRYGAGSNPFNSGEKVRRYKPKELLDVEGSRTARTEFFEDKLVWLYSELGHHVPVAFRLRNGKLRHLDAGCLGYLYNRRPSDLEFRLDDDGRIISVKPSARLRKRSKAKRAFEFTQAELDRDGQKPAMAFLLYALDLGRRYVTYKEVARHLNRTLKLTNVNHHHIGSVVDAMMHRITRFDPDVPLLNALVVRRGEKQPGAGIDDYLVKRYGLAGVPSGDARVREVERAVNEVRVYPDWRRLYARAYGQPYEAVPQLEGFDDDGQGDNPKYRDGRPRKEGPEHKRLKKHVRDHPDCLGLGLADPKAENEVGLPSGDRLDVEIVDGPRRIGVEVKSIRSNDDDLRRGVFQCVKYRAVMDAEAGLIDGLPCEVYLVTERPLPGPLADLARRLDVRQKLVPINL
jgi:hypothetical protein